jgi:CheY-like chemotaxis protein
MSSKEGVGTEFWFTLRLELGKQKPQVEHSIFPDLCEVRAMIVDDNSAVREILMTRLFSWGMRPSEVKNAPAALEALYQAYEEGDPYRLAVIDMQMPGMDGETLGRTITADPRLSGTRMIMLTSLGDSQRIAEIGFTASVTKPIRLQELMGMMSLVLTGENKAGGMPRALTTDNTAKELLNMFAGRTVRILLAEDNITNQHVALGILKKMGVHADAAANGEEAVKAVETLPYDLIFMDVQMPEMDGLEATKQIRNMKKIYGHEDLHLPIIAMTAHAMQGDRERCLAAGMNDYISKPVSPRAIADVLEKWLPKTESGGIKQ